MSDAFYGSFGNEKQLAQFLEPIDHLSSINGGVGIVVNFLKDDSSDIYSTISCINSTIGIVAKIKFNNIFGGFTLSEDCKLGISKVSDFVKLFSLFDKAKPFDLSYDQITKNIKIKQESSEVIHTTADPSVIKEYNKQFTKTQKSYGQFSYTQDFKKFSKAISVLSEEDCVYFEGKAGSDKIQMSVRRKSVVVNTFKMDIATTVNEDFVVAFDKTIIKNIIDSKYESIVFSLCERVSTVECSTSDVTATFYLANMVL